MAKFSEMIEHLAGRGAIKRPSTGSTIYVFGFDNIGWMYNFGSNLECMWHITLADLNADDWETVDLNWELNRAVFRLTRPPDSHLPIIDELAEIAFAKGAEKVIIFPHREEIRFVEVTENTVPCAYHVVEPFNAVKGDYDICYALIRPSEVGKVKLPFKWGGWEDGIYFDKARPL
jgi:hypothetical protein